MLDISVVIPTYNRLDTLRHVIPSLLRQNVPHDSYEIIVADSRSNDGTAEFLAEVACGDTRVRHIPGPYTGRAGARNAGIERALGPIVLFTDADIIASDDLLSRHLARHASARCAVVGQEIQVSSFDDYLQKSRDPELRRPLHPNSRKALSWLYFLTGNASARRADLDAIGRFDEDFTGYGHEDLELGYRIRRAGIPIVYEASAVNYHWHPVPYSEQKGRMELAGRSTARFYRKHPDPMVRLRLGMTPVSLGLHGVLHRAPKLVEWLDRAGATSAAARGLAYQYHYVSGIKAALHD